MFTAGYENQGNWASRANRILITKILLGTLLQSATTGIFLFSKIS
jgi:hypothetical protein